MHRKEINIMLQTTTSRKLSSSAIKTATDIVILEAYRANKSTSYGDKLLQELYNRHDNLLKKLAYKLSKVRPYLGGVEDCLSVVRISAMIAYDRFKTSNQTAKLSTFLYKTVRFEMLTQADSESFVKCPSQLREFRAYYMGGYDNDAVKKANFEAKWGLTNQDLIDAKKKDIEPLLPYFMSLCDPYYTDEDLIGLQQFKDDAAPSQETLSYLSDIDRMKEQFNERQLQVFDLCWVKEHTMQETASILDVTLGKVISANRGIKRIIDSYKKNMKKEMVF
jgi:RNA polymerase sigma factor (sigma-70 family)